MCQSQTKPRKKTQARQMLQRTLSVFPEVEIVHCKAENNHQTRIRSHRRSCSTVCRVLRWLCGASHVRLCVFEVRVDKLDVGNEANRRKSENCSTVCHVLRCCARLHRHPSLIILRRWNLAVSPKTLILESRTLSPNPCLRLTVALSPNSNP